MSDEEDTASQLTDKQKIEIAKWFLLNSPAGEIQYIAKDVKAVLEDERLYKTAAEEAFPLYNKSHMLYLEFPDRSGEVMVTPFSEVNQNEYIDPRTAQVGIVDHVKQVCENSRPANDEELPSPYVEEYRYALDVEVTKYVCEAYPKGICSVYCVSGKDVEEPGMDFELAVVISAARLSPQNFCNGSWRSIWNMNFKDELQLVEVRGKLQVGAHYFEEGNVQLDAKQECKDSTMFMVMIEMKYAVRFSVHGWLLYLLMSCYWQLRFGYGDLYAFWSISVDVGYVSCNSGIYASIVYLKLISEIYLQWLICRFISRIYIFLGIPCDYFKALMNYSKFTFLA